MWFALRNHPMALGASEWAPSTASLADILRCGKGMSSGSPSALGAGQQGRHDAEAAPVATVTLKGCVFVRGPYLIGRRTIALPR